MFLFRSLLFGLDSALASASAVHYPPFFLPSRCTHTTEKRSKKAIISLGLRVSGTKRPLSRKWCAGIEECKASLSFFESPPRSKIRRSVTDGRGGEEGREVGVGHARKKVGLFFFFFARTLGSSRCRRRPTAPPTVRQVRAKVHYCRRRLLGGSKEGQRPRRHWNKRRGRWTHFFFLSLRDVCPSPFSFSTAFAISDAQSPKLLF